MADTVLSFDDLKRALRDAAGDSEEIDLDGDVYDVEFTALGYDSLALLETAAVICREYRITLSDDVVGSVRTPHEFLDAVNEAAVNEAAVNDGVR